jgi:branched-chain amino acid transport system substrate-binding protein
MLQEKVDFLIDGSSSANSFAISQIAKQMQILDIATASEAANLTDKENRHQFIFRAARNTTHDGIAGSLYAKSLPYAKWYALGPDYEYGRSSVEIFMRELKAQKSDAQLVGESWPKLFEPDYTPAIQQIQAAKPDAVYSPLWGGDLAAFIKQAKQFNLFDKIAFFSPNIADSTVLEALGNDMPAGLLSATRWIMTYPDTPVNRNFGEAYRKVNNQLPTNWSVEAYQAIYALKGAIEKAGAVDSAKVAQAMLDLEVKGMPWGDVQFRGSDHQLINYAIGYGKTTGKLDDPLTIEFKADWKDILSREK